LLVLTGHACCTDKQHKAAAERQGDCSNGVDSQAQASQQCNHQPSHP